MYGKNIWPTGREERGAGLAEYGLLLLLVLVACVTALTSLGGAVNTALNSATGIFN